MRGPDVKTVIVTGVASISGFVENVDSLGTLFLSGLIEINKKEVEEEEVVEEEDVVEEVKNITKSKLVTFKFY